MTELFTEVSATRGKELGLWTRRAIVAVLVGVAALAVWGVFGQRDRESTATGNGVTMTVSAPDVVRGGLVLPGDDRHHGDGGVEHPRLVLDDGWVEGLQVNSIEPARGVRDLARRAGRALLRRARSPVTGCKVWLQFQVDPTNPGARSHGLELDDETRTARPHRPRPEGAAVMDLVLRTVFVFVLILLVTRAVGRRELSSMEPFDLILLVVIGDMVQQGVTQSDYSLTGTTIVIATLASMVVGTAYLSYRFKRAAAAAGGRADAADLRRPAAGAQPAARADDRRGGPRRGAPAVDRLARTCSLLGPRLASQRTNPDALPG